MLIVDGHADTLSVALDDRSSLKNKKYSFNINEALEKAPYIQNLATFVHPDYVENKMAFKRANYIIEKFYMEYKESEANKAKIHIVKSNKDISKVIDNNLLGIILSIENGSAIEGNLGNIEYFYNKGVRIMSITWNEDNDLGSGALTNNDIGLTKLGQEYIKTLNNSNILIDISHSSEKSFYDVLKIVDKPIIATHSCVKKICNHPRNLTDNQIKEIANLGGTIGICFYNKFLSENASNATIEDIVHHIEYVAELVGIEHVSIGSDFDGVKQNELPIGITGVRDLNKLFEKLKDRGFSETDIEKIAGENFRRVLLQLPI